MATDVARLSFDPARHYTGVVSQQGRVSLEAEQNEQRVIDAEERRGELLDIIGPAGTPDDGYAVSGSGGTITVGLGTMYVGGLRTELAAPISVTKQPDWLDRPVQEIVDGKGFNEHVVLLLTERDVTAVEDPALYEVALGGPDGAARTRLVQRVELLPTTETTCAGALAGDETAWLAEGLTFDPPTMRLTSNARLLVAWEGDPEPANACEPSSTGGYLGAENQLIRVQITAADEAAGTFDLVWGYDDAAFLYRVTPDASANPILTLERSPVDDYHRPRSGQAVQALRSTAGLESADGVIEGYVAALGGEIGVLAAPYDPDAKTVQFPAPLPAAYVDAVQTPQLYLRIWEAQLTGCQLNTPISLAGTGMEITISLVAGKQVHVDDYWCIAVRPSTPTTVYPDRYLRAPQPPDGPREWACPLAVIRFADGEVVVVEDCRHPFPPLTAATDDGCCTIEVGPSDAGKLQALIDKAAAGRVVGDHGARVTVCFKPGHYDLPAPIVLRRWHSNITLRACSEAAVIAAAPDAVTEFAQGLLVLADVDNVTITGFEFLLPQVPAAVAKIRGAAGTVIEQDMTRAINAEISNRYVSIGIRPVNCAVLQITDCLFRFSLGEHVSTAEIEQTMPRNVFGVAVFASGACWGLRLLRNRFLHHPEVPGGEDGLQRLMTGYLQTPTAATPTADTSATRAIGGARLPALLDDAEIAGNTFAGITAAVVAITDLGTVRVWDNVVRQCYGGVWLVDVTAAANTDLAGRYEVAGGVAKQLAEVRDALFGSLLDPVLMYLFLVGETFPLPSLPDFTPHNLVHVGGAALVGLRTQATATQRTLMTSLVAGIAAGHAPARPPRARATKAAPEQAAPAAPKMVEFNAIKAAVPAAQASRNLTTAWTGLTELSRLAATLDTVTTSLRIERNDIDCALPDDSATGSAMFVFGTLRADAGSTAVIGDNRLSGASQSGTNSARQTPTALVVGLTTSTITGNIVKAAGDVEAPSLVVTAVRNVAITGNVAIGRVVLPGRPSFSAPLNTWRPLNTFV